MKIIKHAGAYRPDNKIRGIAALLLATLCSFGAVAAGVAAGDPVGCRQSPTISTNAATNVPMYEGNAICTVAGAAPGYPLSEYVRLTPTQSIKISGIYYIKEAIYGDLIQAYGSCVATVPRAREQSPRPQLPYCQPAPVTAATSKLRVTEYSD